MTGSYSIVSLAPMFEDGGWRMEDGEWRIAILYAQSSILNLQFSILDPRFFLMPFRGLLVGESDSEDRGFIKVFADDLHANGQLFRIEAAGKRKARESGEVHRDGQYVRKIHLQRVLSFFSDPKGRGRRRFG